MLEAAGEVALHQHHRDTVVPVRQTLQSLPPQLPCVVFLPVVDARLPCQCVDLLHTLVMQGYATCSMNCFLFLTSLLHVLHSSA